MTITAWLLELLPPAILRSVVGWIVDAVFYTMFAITCHRTIILGESYIPSRVGLFWSERETKFIGWIVGLVLLGIACAIPASLIYFVVPRSFAVVETPWLTYAIAYLFVAYFGTRFSLVLPASAVDDNFSFADSWGATTGNGMMLTLAVTIPAFCGLLIALVLDAAIGDKTGFVYDIPYYLVAYLLLAVEIGVISVAYKYIVWVGYNSNAP